MEKDMLTLVQRQKYPSIIPCHVHQTGHVSLGHADYFCTIHSLDQESFQRYIVHMSCTLACEPYPCMWLLYYS